MLLLRTQIEIAAPRSVVWQVLTDFSTYPEWNPLIREADGDLRRGGRVRMRVELAGGMVMMLRPNILAFREEHELRWLGHFLAPFIFNGEHAFLLQQVDEGRTRVVQLEKYRGLLLPLFRRHMVGPVRRGFDGMNEALKGRVEGSLAREGGGRSGSDPVITGRA